MDDIGICGVLEFLLTSDGKMIDTIMPLIFPHLHKLSTHVERCHASEEIPAKHLEQMMNLMTTRMLKIASNFPAYSTQIIEEVLLWAQSFTTNIKEGKGSGVVQFGVAALVGILTAIKLEYGFILDQSDEKLASLFSLLLSTEVSEIVFESGQVSYNLFSLYSALANAGKEYAAGLLLRNSKINSSSFEDIWDELICEQKVIQTPTNVSKTLELINTTFTNNNKWTSFSLDYPGDESFLVTVVQTSVICGLYVTDFQAGSIEHIREMLIKSPEMLETHILDSYVTAVEGLGILSAK